jgi:NADPH2:quinone reductase
MRALMATAYGQPEDLVLGEVPIPQPGAGQLLVRIAAATINPTDIRVITGDFGDEFPLEFPYILGNDFAGTVIETGAGVTAYRVGDEVFGQAMPRQLRAIADLSTRPSVSTGALADYAVFEADTPLLALRPASVSVEQAAALAIGGMTARGVMTTAAIRSGETVLVIGAAGGVGTALIPLLAAAGATVIATAGTEEAGEALRGLGADTIIGYDDREYPHGVDAVLNLQLPADRLLSAAASIRPDGRLVSIMYPPATPEQLGRDDVRMHFVMDLDGELGGMLDVADAAEQGILVATIARRYTLDDGVAAAVDYARRRRLGKIVVTM